MFGFQNGYKKKKLINLKKKYGGNTTKKNDILVIKCKKKINDKIYNTRKVL